VKLDHRLLRDDFGIERLAKAIERAPSGTVLAHDTETGSAHRDQDVPGKKAATLIYAGAYVTGLSVCLSEPGDRKLTGYYVPIAHSTGNAPERKVRELLEAMSRTKARHLLHHATFDWAGLENLGWGYEKQGNTIDTQVARWLSDENALKALKELGEQYCGEDAKTEQRALAEIMEAPHNLITDARNAVLDAFPELGYYKIKGEKVPYDGREGKKLHPNDEAEHFAQQLRRKREWGDILPHEMAPYGARDATMTTEVAEAILPDGLASVHAPSEPLQREMAIQHIIYDMTRRGITVDVDQFYRAGDIYRERAEAIERDFDDTYGHVIRQRFGAKTELNMGSSTQMQWLLYDYIGLPCLLRTEKGGRSVSKDALEMLEGNETVAAVMEAGRWNKALTAYAGPFAWFAENSPDGRIHGYYSSVRTVTGRLAASHPNVMTIPKHGSLPEIREAFYTAPPGYERSGFDLESAELWVAASITGDPALTSALLEGRSLHVETMLAVFGGEPDKDRREYTLSKNVNYGANYEAGPKQMALYAAKAGYNPAEAKELGWKLWKGHRQLFARQHYVADFLKDEAEKRGKLPLHPPGRYRHFRSPGVHVDYYTALNALVQGGIGEFMKDVMLEVYARGYGSLLDLQVHDELVFTHPAGMRQEIAELLTKISEDINPFKYVLRWDDHQWEAAA